MKALKFINTVNVFKFNLFSGQKKNKHRKNNTCLP